MHKLLAIFFSILFSLEIFLVGMPLATQAITPLPKQGQGSANYIPQYSTVAFVYNVSGVDATASNFTSLQNDFGTYFNSTVQVKFPNGTIYTQSLPISRYSNDIYFAINTTSNKIEYVIILADVIGNTSISQGRYVPVNYIYSETGLPNSLVIENASEITQSELYSIPVIGEITTNYIKNDIENPQSTKPSFFYEYVYGVLTHSITIGNISVSTSPTNSVLVFAPLTFVSSGFTNPLQQSGLLGKRLASVSSTMPVIWGRALINTNLYDPYGSDNLTFQLNYSTTGELKITMAQLGWVASITNFPSSFIYQSYNFSNGYESFLGFITDEGKITMAINGQSRNVYPSGQVTINGENYSVVLLTITTKPISVEYLNNLTVYYYTGGQLQSTEFTSSSGNTELPVYNLNASPSSTIVIKGSFNGTVKTISITVGSSPNITTYSDYATLSAAAYEGIMYNSSSYYVNAPIISTPPSTLLIHGITSFVAQGILTPTSGNANITLFNNATLTFTSMLPGISFNGIIVTPAYPLINGTTAMQYMTTMQYQTVGSEYGMEIVGSQIPMETMNNNLEAINILPPFSTTLVAPSLPASLSGTGLLEINFEANPQDSYITLVNMGLWSNETVVTVSAYSEDGNIISSNKGYFYGIVIPPTINVTYEGYNESIVQIYDPDAILDPSNTSGSFTVAPATMVFGNQEVQGSLVFLGSTVYKTQGVFGTSSFNVTPIGTFSYSKQMLVYNNIPAYQLTLNGQVVTPYVNGTYTSLLQYYADNNPTVNLFFGQSVGYPTIKPAYYGGLNSSFLTYLLSPEAQPGFEQIIPSGTDYYLYVYPTFKVLPYYAPVMSPYNVSSLAIITSNSTFIHSTIYFTYESTDYASHYFYPYILKTNVTVQNVTAKLYFQSNVTPLYSSYAKLFYYEPYYGVNLPAYLALGTYGTLMWHALAYSEFEVPASTLYLAKMLSMNVTLQNGQTYSIILTTKNITTLFASDIGQQLNEYNGTYMFEISIPALEKILGMTAQELNQSTLTVTIYDFVTHETLVANTELLALPGLNLMYAQPGGVFYFMTFKANTTDLTASTPWFIGYSVTQPLTLKFTDQQYAHEDLYAILHLSVTNITIKQGNYKASIVYQNGRTVVTNVYGKVVANYTGNLIPTIPETSASSGIFVGQLPFTIIQNKTLMTIHFNQVTIYSNGTLGFMLTNGVVVPLGPAGLIVLPTITYNDQLIGYSANVAINVTDMITSMVVQTQLQASNETPIRLAPIPTIPPISDAPIGTYYYTKPVVITPSAPVINIYATSEIPYPYEFYVVAIVRSGVNASASANITYYSYQAVVAKPALGSTLQPYIEVAIQMNGIGSLPAGQYTVQLFAVPFAQGPAISDYPSQLIFTNVTIES